MNKHPALLFLSIPLSLVLVAAAALAILPMLRAQAQSAAFTAGSTAYVQDSSFNPSASVSLAIVAAVVASESPQAIISVPARDAVNVLAEDHASPDHELRWGLDTDGDAFLNQARHTRTMILLVSGTPEQTISVVYVVDGPHHSCTIKTRL
jgi:hypothetical protein